MKLSIVKKSEITHNILDIYEKPMDLLDKERQHVVLENYLLWIAQYQTDIDNLPIEFFNTSSVLKTLIEVDSSGLKHLNTVWHYSHDVKVPVMSQDSGYYAEPEAQELHPTLQSKVEDILQRFDELISEKSNLRTFVDESLDQVTTTKQLRDLWANYGALLKHIPPEPSRVKKSKQTVLNLKTKLDIQAINQRLTEHLLEG